MQITDFDAVFAQCVSIAESSLLVHFIRISLAESRRDSLERISSSLFRNCCKRRTDKEAESDRINYKSNNVMPAKYKKYSSLKKR